jgi:sensor histidine kinase YesM
VIIILYLVISRRIKRIRDRHAVEKKMLEIERQRFDLEQKALRLQMNPHFIFNSLNSIQSYILTHNTEMAVTYLGKFSQLMRLILNNSGNNYVPFKEELKAIKHYLDLEKLRFDNKFDYKIKVDKNIDKAFVEIPPMTIQPYIENAIIHGILHKPTKGKVNIDFELRNDYIYCSVTDNGIGREKAAKIRESTGIKRRSTGMYVTKARLEMLKTDEKEDFVVKITELKDSEDEKARTKVELMIHYNED